MGRKFGGCVPFLGGGAWSPSNTMWLGPRPTSVPSGILIHPAVRPQQTWVENGGLCFLGGAGPHLTQCGLGLGRLGRGLPPCQGHLDPFSRLSTIDIGRKLESCGVSVVQRSGDHSFMRIAYQSECSIIDRNFSVCVYTSVRS